ncbi:MAG: HPr family phosphocarrier protein [Thermodesulfobacteriota bacterium]
MELKKALRITNDLGLHARSAARIVELAGQFDARLYLSKDGYEVEGGSILSILSLACPKGSEITVRIVGKDGAALMERLSELFERKFEEGQ